MKRKSDLNLQQVEADIKLCETFLRTASLAGPAGGSSKAPTLQEATLRDAVAGEQCQPGVSGSTQQHIQQGAPASGLTPCSNGRPLWQQQAQGQQPGSRQARNSMAAGWAGSAHPAAAHLTQNASAHWVNNPLVSPTANDASNPNERMASNWGAGSSHDAAYAASAEPDSGSTGRQQKLSEDRRREILDRLMAERQRRRSSQDDAVRGSQESIGDRHQRVAQLLRQRRTSEDGPGRGPSRSRDSLMSPESSVGTVSEARFSMRAGESNNYSEPAMLEDPQASPCFFDVSSRARPAAGGTMLSTISQALGASSTAGPIEIDTSILYTPLSTTPSSPDRNSAQSRGGTDASSATRERPGPRPMSAPGKRPHAAGGDSRTAGRGAGQSRQPMTPIQPQSHNRQARHQQPPQQQQQNGREPHQQAAAGGAAQQAGSGPGRPGGQMPRRPSSAPRERPAPHVTVPREFKLSGPHSKKSREAVLERLENERHEDLTFHPRINRSRSPMGRVRPAEAAERLKELSQPRTALWERCAKQKLGDREEELKGCSFKPATGRGPAVGAPAAAAKLPVADRLYQRHDQKYSQWEKLKLESEKAQLKECTFRPATANPDKHLSSYTPIQERVGELQRRKSERLARSRRSLDSQDPDMTFAPTINDNSIRMAIAKEIRELRDDLPVSERLTAVPQHKTRPGVEEAEANCTFTPRINPTSERLLEDSGQVPADFYERQRFFHDLKQDKLKQLQAETEDRDCTFSPDTGTARVVLAGSQQHAMLGESYLEKVERLAYADKQRVEAVRSASAHRYYSQFTFQPAINERSRKIGKANPLSELVKNERVKMVKAAHVKEAEQKFRQEHTFRPATCKPRPHSAAAILVSQPGQQQEAGLVPTARFTLHDQAPETLVKRIEAYRQARSQKLQEARNVKEYAELLDCTFTPAIHRSVPQPQGPVVVRGLERYLELKELAKTQEDEQREREERAFCLKPKANPQQHTIPMPFKLHNDRNGEVVEARRAKLREALVAEAMKECSFKPKTNEATNRELIARILAAEDSTPSLDL